MVWVIVAAAIVVLALGAYLALGHYGEMPEVVTDRQKPHIPDRGFDQDFLDQLWLPKVSPGYDSTQVDEFLAEAVIEPPTERPLFDVVSYGYDMQAVDVVIDRVWGDVVSLASEGFVDSIPEAKTAVGIDPSSAEVPSQLEDAE